MQDIRTYSLLTKPGIIMGNAITMAAGFALASRGDVDPALFLATLGGLSALIGSACVFNNTIDRDVDKQMARTQNRAMARGVVSVPRAISFAIALGLLGAGILAAFTNLLTVSLALCGFLVYVVLYSFLKYQTVHGTLIGSVAGALPPVIGYTAVSQRLDLGALILFGIVALWQMPHFFAIALYRLREYAGAGIPVLPVKRGVQATKIQMLAYVVAFGAACPLLFVYGYAGWGYLLVAGGFGLAWIWLCITGFWAESASRWARKMFVFSLVVITGLCVALIIEACGRGGCSGS